ncbi:MAG: SdpI family protein [Dorea sp.]|nr:SdpI family protein [Dorea sp.]
MRFWLFMFIMDLICPLSMIGFGKLFMNSVPKNINSVFGYRTRMSSINHDTWEFAHKYSGKILYISGLVSLVPSIIVMIFLFGKSRDVIGNTGAAVEAVQIVLIVSVIFPTEIALRKKFDRDGNRKELP